MIKVVTLLTRKPGMSREAFIEHYETHHRKIGEKYLSGFAVKYQRRYLQSAGFRGQEGATLPFDVLMEIWYPDQDTLDAALAVLSKDEAQAEIIADEERLFDRDLIRSYTVEEYESEMPAVQADS
ncbi:MAG: EthD domain-containing protein [Halieaceae bacterium]